MIRTILAALITMIALSAQEVRGTITGTVADPQGAIIVGAKVVARNLAIGSVTEAVTNETGLCRFSRNSSSPSG